MAEKQLFDFRHNGDKINVFTGNGTSDVYYRKNGGSTRSAGMRYKSDRGTFATSGGKTLNWSEAESHVRGLL